MKTSIKVLLVLFVALQFASCGKKNDAVENAVNENLFDAINTVSVSETENIFDLLNLFGSVNVSDNVTERRKQGYLRNSGNVIYYTRDEDSRFIFYCNIYNETSSTAYHHTVYIDVNEYGFTESFEKKAFGEDSVSRRRYQPISSLFNFGLFLEHLKEFLLSNNETEEDVNIIIDLLSSNESYLLIDPEQRKAQVLNEARNRPPIPQPRTVQIAEKRENDIVLSYEKNGNDFIIYCDIFFDNPNFSVPYYYNMYIYKSSGGNTLVEYFEKKQPYVVTAPMYFTQPLSSFDYEAFVGHLKTYLEENGENSMNVDTMLGLLSKIEEDVLSSLEYFN